MKIKILQLIALFFLQGFFSNAYGQTSLCKDNRNWETIRDEYKAKISSFVKNNDHRGLGDYLINQTRYFYCAVPRKQRLPFLDDFIKNTPQIDYLLGLHQSEVAATKEPYGKVGPKLYGRAIWHLNIAGSKGIKEAYKHIGDIILKAPSIGYPRYNDYAYVYDIMKSLDWSAYKFEDEEEKKAAAYSYYIFYKQSGWPADYYSTVAGSKWKSLDQKVQKQSVEMQLKAYEVGKKPKALFLAAASLYAAVTKDAANKKERLLQWVKELDSLNYDKTYIKHFIPFLNRFYPNDSVLTKWKEKRKAELENVSEGDKLIFLNGFHFPQNSDHTWRKDYKGLYESSLYAIVEFVNPKNGKFKVRIEGDMGIDDDNIPRLYSVDSAGANKKGWDSYNDQHIYDPYIWVSPNDLRWWKSEE